MNYKNNFDLYLGDIKGQKKNEIVAVQGKIINFRTSTVLCFMQDGSGFK